MNKKGFTLVEMVFCISVILVILLLVIPNVIYSLVNIKLKGHVRFARPIFHLP
jgi:prepilin-type N-terminal cleavage/methylation domain-containing protein